MCWITPGRLSQGAPGRHCSRRRPASPVAAAGRRSSLSRERPFSVVAFGGGTGLPVLLEGLRDLEGQRVTAVVTVADDGGSSGRLRQELGVAPPGDVRRCLVALAGRRRLAEVFDYRFEGGESLRDHSVGNLIIAALADMSGDFSDGVKSAARFLRVKGQVFPAATESLTLVVDHVDGTVTRGESSLREAGRPVRRVAVEPAGAPAPAGAVAAVRSADLVVLCSGSLFTSTIPSLLGAGVAEALRRRAGPVVYCANVMTQAGETDGFTVSDHLRAITEHVGPVVTDVLVAADLLGDAVLGRYRAEDAAPVAVDDDAITALGVRLHAAELLDGSQTGGVRHDPAKLARAVRGIAQAD